jgi:methionyl-tRNA synthetase
VLYNLAESLRIVAILLTPYLTSTPQKMFAHLAPRPRNLQLKPSHGAEAFPAPPCIKARRSSPASTWKRACLFRGGSGKSQSSGCPGSATRTGSAGNPREATPAAPAKHGHDDDEAPAEIEYDDFAKIDLRLAKVVACEEIKRAKSS